MKTLTPTEFHALAVEDALSDRSRLRVEQLLGEHGLTLDEIEEHVTRDLDEHQRAAYRLAVTTRSATPIGQRGTLAACARQAMEIVLAPYAGTPKSRRAAQHAGHVLDAMDKAPQSTVRDELAKLDRKAVTR